MMKTQKVAVFVLSSLLVCLSIFALSTSAYAGPVVGVKEGDWVEYSIDVTGTGSLPPSHDVRWMLMEVLTVNGEAFSVNVTVRYVNGTMSSAIWEYNFSEGNTEGWTIIPANLSPDDTFFDYSEPDPIIVQREEQKIVLGATRTVTYGNDSVRQVKEWDKVTGFFVGSLEVIQNHTNSEGWYIENLTVTIRPLATNLWSRQIYGLDQPIFALALSGVAFLVVLFVSALIIWQRKKLTSISLRHPTLAKRVVSIILVGIVVFTALVVPSIWMGMGLSDAQVNMIMQSLWMSLILVSLWFRKIDKYFEHGLLMTAVVIATLIGFASVIFMWSPSDSSSLSVYFSSPLKIAEFIAHGVLSIPALVFGGWFIALWRPNSSTFPSRSKKIVKLLTITWVLSFIVGIIGYLVDYTTILGVS